MAEYGDQIAGMADGAGVPTGWTSRWASTGVTYTVSADAAAPGGKKLNITTSTSARRFISLDAANSDGDRGTAQVIALVRANTNFSGAAASLSGPAARGSGSASSETAQIAVAGKDTGEGQLRHLQYAAGSPTTHYVSGNVYSSGQLVWLVSEVDGTSGTVSLYLLNDLFGTPLATDTATIPDENANNWVGIFSFSPVTDVDYLWFSVGTGTDNAPAPTGTTASADNFDSAIGSASVGNSLTSTPTVTITPYDPADVSGWLTGYIRVSGVDGKTPDFALDFTAHRLTQIPQNAEWSMVWRYVDDATVPSDGRPRPWSEFDNNTGNVSHTFSNNAAFTFDEIEVAVKPRWRYLDTQRAFAYARSTGLAIELPSSIAASALPQDVHAQFTFSGTPANTATIIPINMYACLVDDTSVQPDGGLDKLNFVIIPGQHSSEDQGNDSCWETVFLYTDGVGTAADAFRKNCRLFIYDVNPQGRYYGKERWTEETDGDEDPNREWIPGGGASSQVNAVMDAMALDLGRVDVLWDFHGDFRLYGNGVTDAYGIFESAGTETLWRARVNALLSGSPIAVADLGAPSADTAKHYGTNTLLAQLSSTLEFPIAPPGYPDPQTAYESVMVAYVTAVLDMTAAGELAMSGAGDMAVDSIAGLGMSAQVGYLAGMATPASHSSTLSGQVSAQASVPVDAQAGVSMLARADFSASIVAAADHTSQASGQAVAAAIVTAGAQHNQAMTGQVDSVGEITANMVVDVIASASASAQAQAIVGFVASVSGGTTMSGGLAIEAAMSLSSTADVGMSATMQVPADMSVGGQADASISPQAAASADIQVSAQAATSLLAQAAAQAGFVASSIHNVTITATSISGDFVTPDERTFTVSLELREFTVPADSRTFTVH